MNFVVLSILLRTVTFLFLASSKNSSCTFNPLVIITPGIGKEKYFFILRILTSGSRHFR